MRTAEDTGAARRRNWLALGTLLACWGAEASLPEDPAADREAAALRAQSRHEPLRHQYRDSSTSS